MRDGHTRSLQGRVDIGSKASLLSPCYLIGIGLEQVAHALGDTIDIESSLLAVGQDGARTIIARGDDEALTDIGIEDVIVSLIGRGASASAWRLMGNGGTERDLGILLAKEVNGTLSRLLSTNRFCLKRGGNEKVNDGGE